MTSTHAGRCLCGAITFEVRGPLRDVVNCHCGQCRRFHGHYAAYTAAVRGDVHLTDPQDRLSWYRSSEKARRGFCSRCGSSLFWDRFDAPTLGIAAGPLDQPTGLRTMAHIYTADPADYYRLDDDLEKRSNGLSDEERPRSPQ